MVKVNQSVKFRQKKNRKDTSLQVRQTQITGTRGQITAFVQGHSYIVIDEQ